MTTVAELIKQKEALENQIAQLRQSERADVISKIKLLISEHDLTAQDIFGGAKVSRKSGARQAVAPKYRNPETGATWSGRGKSPKWLDGQDRSKFAV